MIVRFIGNKREVEPGSRSCVLSSLGWGEGDGFRCGWEGAFSQRLRKSEAQHLCGYWKVNKPWARYLGDISDPLRSVLSLSLLDVLDFLRIARLLTTPAFQVQ